MDSPPLLRLRRSADVGQGGVGVEHARIGTADLAADAGPIPNRVVGVHRHTDWIGESNPGGVAELAIFEALHDR